MSWHIQGSYFEACNCEAICPCRRIDGTPGGRSTHGVCMGVLSWLIADGATRSSLAAARKLRCSETAARTASCESCVLFIDRKNRTTR